MAIRIDDLNKQRLMTFKSRLRTDRRFLHEFYENPIAVLDRELSIHIDPRSRIAKELLEKIKKKGENDWIPPPNEAGCAILSYGKGCLVVAWAEG
jgi:hypothetical protein